MKHRAEPEAHTVINTRVSGKLKRAALREAAERGITVRSVLEAALRDRYDPERAARDKQLIVRELKTLRRELTHVSAGNKVLFEAMALLVKNLFSSLTPPTAEGRVAGDQFYARFIDAVVRAIENNEPLMDQVLSLAIVNYDSETKKSDAEVSPMLKDALQESTQDRLAEMMTNAMGAAIGDLLHDASVEELRANPDGRLWCVRDGMRHDTKKTLSTAARRQLINIVAHAVGVTVDEDNPSFPAELPESGYRFHAVVPPQSPDGPTFVIRKKPSKVFSLDDYVAAGIMTGEQAAFIRQAVANRENILVGGGTGSGKTTLANAILQEIGRIAGRVLTVEDTLELQVEAEEVVRQRTVRNGNTVRRTMQDVVRDMLRLSPDRIIVGEVRGPEAIDMIQGWNTGHPGGVATIHCNSAPDALERLEDLLIQGGYTPVPRQIAKAVNVILFIGPISVDTPEGPRARRRLQEIVRVVGVRAGDAGYEYTVEPYAVVQRHL